MLEFTHNEKLHKNFRYLKNKFIILCKECLCKFQRVTVIELVDNNLTD